jgi:hypothetical protein
MPKLYAVADSLTRRLPRLVSPKGHAIADYVAIGAFAVAGALFWRTNRRAATAALLCGGAQLALNLATDYPGGVINMLTFPAHGKVDMGLAALTATMPELLGFREGRSFFLAQSGAITATTNLTRFSPVRNYARRNHPNR